MHSVWRPGTVLTGNYWDGYLTLPFTRPRRAAREGGDARRRGRDGRARVREVLPRHDHRRGRDRRRAVRHRAALVRARRPPAAARARRRRAAVPAQDRRALRLHLPRHLPPALHPVLPRDEGVLRAGARPADAGRRGDHQRRAPRGLGAAGAGADGHDGIRVPAHRARRRARHQHAADGQHGRAVARAPARRGAAPDPDLRPVALADARGSRDRWRAGRSTPTTRRRSSGSSTSRCSTTPGAGGERSRTPRRWGRATRPRSRACGTPASCTTTARRW